MMFHIEIIVRKKRGVLDPEGNTIASALKRLGYNDITSVRVSKLFDLFIDSHDKETAIRAAQKIASEVLANPIIEDCLIGKVEKE